MIIRLSLATCLILFLASGCSRPQQPTLYSSIDYIYTEELLGDRLETVHLIGDTEATKSTGLINRLMAERDRPVADVFLSGDPMRTALLEKEGTGARYKNREVAARFRMLLINREKETQPTRPSSTLDLALPEFAPNACLANPQFGTTSMHLAVLLDTYGTERTQKFLENFVSNGGTLVASNGEVKRRVSSGEFIYGLTDSDDVSVAVSDGKPVDFVIPDQDTFGAIAIPMTAVVITGAPHPDKALELAEYLTSPRAETIMAESLASHFPVRTPTEKPSGFNFSYSEVKVADLNHARLAEALEAFQPWLNEWVARNR